MSKTSKFGLILIACVLCFIGGAYVDKFMDIKDRVPYIIHCLSAGQ